MQKKPEVSTEMDADQPWDRVEDEWSQDGNTQRKDEETRGRSN